MAVSPPLVTACCFAPYSLLLTEIPRFPIRILLERESRIQNLAFLASFPDARNLENCASWNRVQAFQPPSISKLPIAPSPGPYLLRLSLAMRASSHRDTVAAPHTRGITSLWARSARAARAWPLILDLPQTPALPAAELMP